MPPRWHWSPTTSAPHRKARSSNSSMSAGKSSPGVLRTCQEFPGNSPSTHSTSFQTPSPSSSPSEDCPSHEPKLSAKKSTDYSLQTSSEKSKKANGLQIQ